jgi:hypothetical protein
VQKDATIQHKIKYCDPENMIDLEILTDFHVFSSPECEKKWLLECRVSVCTDVRAPRWRPNGWTDFIHIYYLRVYPS